MNFEILKKIVLAIVPEKLHLPMRFYYERLTGNQEPEMLLLDQLLGSKKLVVDVGANYGLYSYYLAKSGKHVEAFEPLPGCASTIGAYQSPHIRVHIAALSSAAGSLRLFTPVINGVPYTAWSSFAPVDGTCESREVPVRTLDEYAFKDVCLVKIDVEGHELEVLKGAVQTLRRERPLILVEIEQRHMQEPMTDVFVFLAAQGFAGFFLDSGVLRPLSDFAYDIHQRPFLANIDNPAYINNFFFFPEEAPVPVLSVHPETSNFVRVQGARKTKKRSVQSLRDHFSATEQHGNRAKGPFPDGH